MPRSARSVAAGMCYHVLNRGNGRTDLFHKPADFDAFVKVLAEGLDRYAVDLFAWCLMSNHWHLVLRPRKSEALGRFMGWVGVTHVRRHHSHYHSVGGGHLYQGRFKSFPVEDDRHFLTVCRYVEANPLRAKIVKAAEIWTWSSLSDRVSGGRRLSTAKWPVDRPAGWTALVNQPIKPTELQALQTSVTRDRPFGSPDWVSRTAKRLGMEYSIRPRGRPRKPTNK